jgi:hypothetical protein
MIAPPAIKEDGPVKESGMRVYRVVFSATVLLAAVASLALAQTPASKEGANSAYRPGLGDLMTMTVQPRHMKLALAGRAQNWPYAAYELHELQEAFDRAAAMWPQWRSMPLGEMVKSVMGEPIASLDQAIKAKDAARYDAAYRQLTAACDTCHQSADRAVIVIRVPEGDFFPDQEFRPAGR